MPEFSGSQHAYTCLPGLEYSLVRAVDASCPRNDTASVAALTDGRLMIVWHKYLSNERGTSDFGTIEIASRTPRPSFRATILSAPPRPLPPSILMLRILASHGCRQHPAPANLLFITFQTFRKDERRSDANKWQRPNAATEGFKPCRRRL